MRLKRHFTKHLNQEEIILKENFFEINPSKAIAVLKQMAIEDVTLTVQYATYKVDI